MGRARHKSASYLALGSRTAGRLLLRGWLLQFLHRIICQTEFLDEPEVRLKIIRVTLFLTQVVKQEVGGAPVVGPAQVAHFLVQDDFLALLRVRTMNRTPSPASMEKLSLSLSTTSSSNSALASKFAWAAPV